MKPSTRLVAFALTLALGAISLTAQQPLQPQAPQAPSAGRGAAPGGPGAAAGAPGGGRGGVQWTPTQAIALANMNVPPALVQAAADAEAALLRASLTLPTTAADLQAKADASAKADLALAQRRASEFQRVGGPALGLTPDQLTAISTNNGLPRGGNTSPGGTFAYSDYTGFTKIWDGKTLTGWHGETDGWQVTDDGLQMDVARLPGQHHIHFMGLPGVSPILKDFDFKVEFKASAGNYNGGVQYRSRLLSSARSTNGQPRGISDAATIADPFGKLFPANITTLAAAQAAGLVPTGAGNPWQVSGYQFDITGNNLGSLYEGQGRGVIVNAGEIVQLLPGGLRFVIGRAADNPASYAQPNQGLAGEWNQVQIIARGNTLVHILNGHVVTVTTDDDPMRRAYQGMLSLQCEGGAIWYRNVYLKHLAPIVAETAPRR